MLFLVCGLSALAEGSSKITGTLCFGRGVQQLDACILWELAGRTWLVPSPFTLFVDTLLCRRVQQRKCSLMEVVSGAGLCLDSERVR